LALCAVSYKNTSDYFFFDIYLMSSWQHKLLDKNMDICGRWATPFTTAGADRSRV